MTLRVVVKLLGLQARIEVLALTLPPLPTSTILWAYGKMLRHPGIELMEALLSTVTTSIQELEPQA